MNPTPPQSAARSALTLDDFASLARAGLQGPVWDYIAGGAGDERTLAANLRAFDEVRLLPRVLTGVSEPDTRVTLFGRDWALPFAVAPMAYHTLVTPDGELATVRAAGAVGAPVVVSTFAGRTFEELSAAATVPLWLQTYCFRDRSVTRKLIERAEDAGFEALVLTVDTPRLGRRLRDLRNGFRFPAGVRPVNLGHDGDFSSPADHALAELEPRLDWSVLTWLREVSGLPVVVKGILGAADAVRAVETGADGIVVSNHGGRQLDGSPATLEALPGVVSAVRGHCPVLLDGGVRRGSDVLAALALGASAVLVGRPVLHGLAVGREDGAGQVMRLLADELRDAMTLTGTADVAAAGAPLVVGGPVPAGPRRRHTPGPSETPETSWMPETPETSWTPRTSATGRPPSTPPRQQTPEQPELCSEISRAPATAAPRYAGAELSRHDLHASVSDPVLDTMNFLNEVTTRFPDAISFAPGRPHEEFFETEDVFRHLRRFIDHLAEQGASADEVRTLIYQYGPTAGHVRELIAASLRVDEGIDVPAESIVVTVGCQEAMVLVLRALFPEPGDSLLVASPCYVGITGAARLLDIPVTGVEDEPGGIPADVLEAAILAERTRGRRPRAFYVVPDHSNPSGTTMSAQRRSDLLELAARHDIFVLEDSPYRWVSPGSQLPTLKSLDRQRRVVHLGSYSKTAFPGARVGFVVADQRVVRADGGTNLLADELAKIKSMVTVNTPTLSQAVVGGMLVASEGRISERNATAAGHYGKSLTALVRALERHFPPAVRAETGVGWNVPSGGFFLGMRVPFAADNASLTRSAQDFGVIWTPMSYFYPEGGGEQVMRLAFSALTPAAIDEGIGRLGSFIRSEAAR